MERKKRFAPKVRTGCVTCKSRHIKCDETKPRCEQCTSTGRKCGGYLPQTIKSTTKKSLAGENEVTPDLTVTVPKLFSNGSASEANLLRWYLQVSCPLHYMHVDDVLLSRALAKSELPDSEAQLRNREFWFEIVPQECRNQPAIRQAAIAYAALYCSQLLESHENREMFRAEYLKRRLDAMHLVSTSNDGSTIWHTLLGCIFFTCCEFASGNLAAGASHIRAGNNIIQELDNYTSIPRPQVALIQRYLQPIISLFAARLGTDSPKSDTQRSITHDGATPLERIEKKWISVARLAQRLDWIVDTTSSMDSKFDLISGVKRDIANLSTAIDVLEMDVGLHQTTLKCFRFLQSYKRILVITTYSYPCTSECAFDDLDNLYASVIQNMRAFFEVMETTPITMCAQRSLLKTSIFPKLWIIPPLFLTATQCRTSSVRWDAVRMLSLLDRTEGEWNSNLAAHIATEVINIEEDAARQMNPEDGDKISEEDRIRLHSVHRVPDSPNHIKIFYKRFPYDIITPVRIKEIELPAAVFTSEIQWPISKRFSRVSYDHLPDVDPSDSAALLGIASSLFFPAT